MTDLPEEAVLARAMCFADHVASCETWEARPQDVATAWREASQQRREVAERHARVAIRALKRTPPDQTAGSTVRPEPTDAHRLQAALKAASKRLDDIASGSAYQPRLHAAAGRREIDAALAGEVQ